MNKFRLVHTKIKSKIYKKVRSVRVFKLYRKNGNIYSLTKRVTTKDFRKHFGIFKTNRVVGYTPDYVGCRPGKPIEQHNHFLEFIKNKGINNLESRMRSQFIKSLNSPRIVYQGSYSTCNNHLKVICADNKSTFDTKEIFRILDLAKYKWFASPECDFKDTEEMLYQVEVKTKSNSGHYTSKLAGTKKGTSFLTNYTVATELFDEIKKVPMKNYYLWEIFAREKDIKLEGPNGEVGTRAILNTEGPAALLLTWFSQKFTHYINKSENLRFKLEDKLDLSKTEDFEDQRKNYDFELEADWSNFDASVDSNFIDAGCSVLLSNFSNSDINKRIAYYIYSSIKNKYVLFPPGIVVEINRAIPSGHPFTTIINCTINLIYWSLIGYYIYGDDYCENMDLTVYGDDAKVFFKKHPNLNKIDEIVEKIGLRSDPLVPKLFDLSTIQDINDTPDFLKRRFHNYQLIWNREKMFDRILYQTRKRDISEQIDLVYSYVTTAPDDLEFRSLSLEYFNYLNLKYNLSESDKAKIELIRSEINYQKFLDNYNLINTINKSDWLNKNLLLTEVSEQRKLSDEYPEVSFGIVKEEDIILLKGLSLPISELNKKDKNFFFLSELLKKEIFDHCEGWRSVKYDPFSFYKRKLLEVYKKSRYLFRKDYIRHSSTIYYSFDLEY